MKIKTVGQIGLGLALVGSIYMPKRGEAQTTQDATPIVAAPIRVGTPARVSGPPDASGARWHYGKFASIQRDTVMLRGDAGTVDAYPPGAWRELEINPSAHGSRGTHALVGALVGAAVGAVAAIAFPAKCRSSTADVPCALGAPIELAVDVSLGALLGGLVGTVLPAAHWERVMPQR
jgi:hypothetical protein